MEGRICNNPFSKFYEKGHNPLCPYIEDTCPETGKIIRRKPKSVTTFINTLTDEEIGDYLTPEELKAMRQYKQPSDDECGREQREKEKEKELKILSMTQEIETLTSRNRILENHGRHIENILTIKEKDFEDYKRLNDIKISSMNQGMEKLASLISQLLKK